MSLFRPLRATRIGTVAACVSGCLLAWGGWVGAADKGGATVYSLGDSKACSDYRGVPEGFGKDVHAGMKLIGGGVFEPGSTQGYPDERPSGRVSVAAFWMDRTEVTNAQFAAFVVATAYVTETEEQGGAAVFKQPAASREVQRDGDWWHYVPGANWRHPEGPGSDLTGRAHEPVVLITRKDALAYARWLGHDLPTEAEWEFAARGDGRSEQLERNASGKPVANFWQGIFPVVNTREDGYPGRSPVGCYPANGYGLYDMIGNVWEWTRDAYSGEHQGHGNGDPFASTVSSGRNLRPGAAAVIKGGSFLCSADYCVRYRASARYPQEENLGTNHVGFRTVLREN